jgi:hypothetical protein
LQQDGHAYEPGVKVAPDGTVFVHAHKANAAAEGTQFSSWVWWSRDDGATWHAAPSGPVPREAFHAFEGDVAFDGDHAWFLDGRPSGGTLTSWRLDGSGPVWESTTPTVTARFGDRPWIEAGEGTLYVLSKTPLFPGTDPPGDAAYQLQSSRDGGTTWASVKSFTGSSWCDLAMRPGAAKELLVGCDQNTVTDPGVHAAKVWSTVDEGATWVVDDLGQRAFGSANQFVSVALASDGTAFHAWSDDDPEDDKAAVLHLARRLPGQAWEDLRLPAPNGTIERVWMDVGGGRVAVSFSARATGASAWFPYVMVAQANATRPSWQTVQLDPEPQGEAATAPGDFWQSAFGPDGRLHACYGHALPATPLGNVDFRNQVRCVHERR